MCQLVVGTGRTATIGMIVAAAGVLSACGPAAPLGGANRPAAAAAPGAAPVIDRFSRAAAHLLVRDANPALPAAGAPIDLDRPPFVTAGLGPDGAPVRYYNFDVQPAAPAIVYRLTRAGARAPIAGQLDVVDVVPGDAGYSDFWRIAWVEVPDGFVPGSITSVAELRARRWPVAFEDRAIDCPVVPAGTTARGGAGVAPPVWTRLAYRGAEVGCLAFGEPLALAGDRVPTSPIYVTFRVNPGAAGGGPPSGFRREGETPQTHNVVLSVPGDVDYSPLWAVHIYDRAAFDAVHDEASALAAPLVEPHGPLVNCPIIAVAAKR